MTLTAGGNDINNQYGMDLLNQAPSKEVASPFSEMMGATPGSNFEGQSTNPPPTTDPNRPAGAPPRDLIWNLDQMPQDAVEARVDEFLTEVDNPLETALYTNPEAGLTHEGWAAVREFAGEKMSAALEIVGKFLGPDAQVSPSQADLAVLMQSIPLLGAVEALQERLGLSNTPQGQIISIAHSSISAMSNGIAGAMADPVGGQAHLAELHSGFSGVAQVMASPTQEQLNTWVVGTANVEIFSSDIVQGIVSDAVKLDLGVPQLADGTFDPAYQLTAAEVNAHPLASDDIFAFVVNPEFGLEDIDPAAMSLEEYMELQADRRALVDGTNGFVLSDYIGVVGDADDSIDEEVPEEAVVEEGVVAEEEDGPVVPEGTSSFLDADLEGEEEVDNGDDVLEEPVEEPDQVELDEDEVPEETSGSSELGFGDSPLWRPISVDFQRLEDSATDLDTVFSSVVTNLDNLVGQDLLFDTPLMANFTIFLEDLGNTLDNVTLQEAQEISGVASTLATDLFDNMAALDAAGYSDTPAFAAAEVLGEVLSTVFYAGEIAQRAPQVGADIMNDYVQPFVSGLGDVFNRATQSYAETGVIDRSIQDFLVQSRDLAVDLYVTVFNLNAPAADDPDVDTDTSE